MPTLRGIDDRPLPLGAWLRERVGVVLRRLRVRADPQLLPPPPHLELTLAARSAGKAQSVLRLDADYVVSSHAERRALYTDFLTGFLLPRTSVWIGEDLLIETNSLGCRGAELEFGRPVVAFFGDSTTLGVLSAGTSVDGESWTAKVDLPGYAVLNAGVEGLQMDAVGRRYQSLRQRVPLACAVFYTGWHNLIYNRRSREYWEKNLQSYLSDEHRTVVCTLPTPLLPEMRERGIGPLVNESPEASIEDDYFHFWRGWDPDHWLVELIDAHERFNAHLADFCARTQTPLIDLYASIRPAGYEQAPVDFFDVCHLRRRAYPKVGRFIGSELAKLLPELPSPVSAKRPLPERRTPQPAEDLRRNIYPIW